MTRTRAFDPRYLLRFDDLCPGMDWHAWNQIEALLIRFAINPILAVVPDNRDPNLNVGAPARDFWDRVRSWQARGWAIGLHGYQHLYVNRNPGLLGLNQNSEFAGLGYQEQFDKLSLGLEIFAREGVRADAWVAPSHSFDLETVKALKALGLSTISDGFAFSPFRDALGMTWVPQQFATMRRFPVGIWTFCYHSNGMSPAMGRFGENLERLHSRFISLHEAVAFGDRPISMADALVGAARMGVSRIRRLQR